MGLFLFWLICAGITAVIASNKGRAGFAWFLVGFLLGPFGIILALVVSKDVQQIEAQSLAAGATRKCPHCAELVRREAVKCRYCGAELAPLGTGVLDPGAHRRPPEARFNCARCGYAKDSAAGVLHNGRWYCHPCVQALEVGESRRSTLRALKVGLLVLLPLGALLGLMQQARQQKPAPALASGPGDTPVRGEALNASTHGSGSIWTRQRGDTDTTAVYYSTYSPRFLRAGADSGQAQILVGCQKGELNVYFNPGIPTNPGRVRLYTDGTSPANLVPRIGWGSVADIGYASREPHLMIAEFVASRELYFDFPAKVGRLRAWFPVAGFGPYQDEIEQLCPRTSRPSP